MSATLDQDIARHLEHLRVERRLAVRSLSLYRDALSRLQRFAAEVSLRELSAQHIRRFAARLHAEGLAPRSIALVLSAWRGFYRWLGREGLTKLNPVDAVRAPKAGKPLPKALSVDQAVQLAAYRSAERLPRSVRSARGEQGSLGRAGVTSSDETSDPALEARDRSIVELLYGAGLRVSELTGLDVAASPQARGWIDLREAEAFVLGKGSKRRSVPVGRAAIDALRDWLVVRAQLAGDAEPALFVSTRGTRLTSSQVRSRLRKRALEAGVPTHVHPHMLRHSFASHVLQSSGDLRAVQELLGHANIATTQVYTKLDYGHLSKVYDLAHPRAKRRR